MAVAMRQGGGRRQGFAGSAGRYGRLRRVGRVGRMRSRGGVGGRRACVRGGRQYPQQGRLPDQWSEWAFEDAGK